MGTAVDESGIPILNVIILDSSNHVLSTSGVFSPFFCLLFSPTHYVYRPVKCASFCPGWTHVVL